jgi:hypothetical protein
MMRHAELKLADGNHRLRRRLQESTQPVIIRKLARTVPSQCLTSNSQLSPPKQKLLRDHVPERWVFFALVLVQVGDG